MEDRGEGKPRRRENNTVKEEIQEKMKIYEDVDSLRKEDLKKVSKENSQGREQEHPERSKEGTAEYNQSYMIKCEGKTKEREEEEKKKKNR